MRHTETEVKHSHSHAERTPDEGDEHPGEHMGRDGVLVEGAAHHGQVVAALGRLRPAHRVVSKDVHLVLAPRQAELDDVGAVVVGLAVSCCGRRETEKLVRGRTRENIRTRTLTFVEEMCLLVTDLQTEAVHRRLDATLVQGQLDLAYKARERTS